MFGFFKKKEEKQEPAPAAVGEEYGEELKTLGAKFRPEEMSILAVTGANGFGGPLEILVGFDESGDILGYTVLSTVETPGLGVKADTWFQKGGKGDIIGRNPGERELSVTKDGGEIDAITASTITSRALLGAVNAAYHAFKGNWSDATSGASQKAGTADVPNDSIH